MGQGTEPFRLLESTIDDVHRAYQSGRLTARRLTKMYLERIEAYDKQGPKINAIITLNSDVIEDAARLDKLMQTSGPVGTLHGIPVIIKDQADAKGMPTTLGCILFKNYYPDRDSFVVDKLRRAGAIILAKSTLGELGGGDTHGSLFGSTRNPYALDRTVGGSSGGSAASVSANFTTLAVGQEGLASIRRPAAWNCIVGMRATAGLVSRSGVYSGWPALAGSLGPMARTVRDMTVLLDAMVGYDPEDPLTAWSSGHVPGTYTSFLQKDGLKGARLGVVRESMGIGSEPDSEDFRKVTEVFDRAVEELRTAGAELIDPCVIPKLTELVAKRAAGPEEAEESFKTYFSRSATAPFSSLTEMMVAPEFVKLSQNTQKRLRLPRDLVQHYHSLLARDELMINVLKTMADYRLDAIVHKSVEHQPTMIFQGTNPPYVNYKGATHLNTFLVFVPSITVPAGFTRDNLPAGISFLGRPFDEAGVIKLAYAYERATQHRRPPAL